MLARNIYHEGSQVATKSRTYIIAILILGEVAI